MLLMSRARPTLLLGKSLLPRRLSNLRLLSRDVKCNAAAKPKVKQQEEEGKQDPPLGRVHLTLGGSKTREIDVPKGGVTIAADSTNSDNKEELASLTNNCTVLLYHLSTSCCNNHNQLRPWITNAYSTVDGQTFSSF